MAKHLGPGSSCSQPRFREDTREDQNATQLPWDRHLRVGSLPLLKERLQCKRGNGQWGTCRRHHKEVQGIEVKVKLFQRNREYGDV